MSQPKGSARPLVTSHCLKLGLVGALCLAMLGTVIGVLTDGPHERHPAQRAGESGQPARPVVTAHVAGASPNSSSPAPGRSSQPARRRCGLDDKLVPACGVLWGVA